MSVERGDITRLLSEAVGSSHLSSTVADTTAHALDFWPRGVIRARERGWPSGPAWVVWPGATAEVSQVLRIASAHAIPVLPFGAGSSLAGGGAPPGEGSWIVLSTRRMGDLLDLDEESMTVHAQAGIVGVELEERLNARGYSLGHVPTSMSNATLGGWLSTRSAGLLSSRYGRITDLCLGATAVLADGRVVHTRLAPRRAVGPDLLQLLLGSEGTLGVIGSAHLRLHRLPLHRQFTAFGFGSLGAAADALRGVVVQGLQPLVARAEPDVRAAERAVMRRLVVASERAGGGQQPGGRGGAPWLLVLAFEGAPERVEAQMSLARQVVEGLGGVSLGPAPARHWWGQRFTGMFHFGPHLAAPGGVADQVDLGVPWSRLGDVEQRVVSSLARLGLTTHVMVEHVRPEGVCLSVQFWGHASEDGDALSCYDEAWRAVARAAEQGGGWLGHVFGAGRHRGPLLDPSARPRLRLLSAVKRRLDPAGVLNPGVLGAES